MSILLATASGEEHGLINTLTNSVPFDEFKNMSPSNKAKCEKERKDDSRRVKARYLNQKGASARLIKPYCRWAGDPIQIWKFIPNQIYEVPYGLIKEVNGTVSVKRAGLCGSDDNLDGTSKPTEKDSTQDPTQMFVPINFF